MATMRPLPAQTENPIAETGAAEAAETMRDEALVPSSRALVQEPMEPGPAVARIPVELEVAVPVRGFRVRNLLALATGQVIETQWGAGEDLPVGAGDVQLAWSEFEVVETTLGVRLTRLA